MKFAAAKGARFTSKQAQAIGARVEMIRKGSGGLLTPGAVVEDAKDEDSPLHGQFEWNDRSAAHEARLSQARNLINHLLVVVKMPDGTQAYKGYQSLLVTVSEETDEQPARAVRVYVTTGQAFNDPGLRKQVIADAIAKAEMWEARFREYKELAPIFKAIRQVRKQLGG